MPSQIIQWFPGHMAKTRRLISDNLKNVDAVIEMRDARIPMSSKNPEIERLINGKPRIILLNKASLADEEQSKYWVNKLNDKSTVCILTDCTSGQGLNRITAEIQKLCAEKLDRYAEKGMSGRRLRAMVLGIPNVGKSSLINKLSGSKKAKVEDRPGVTRDKQWVATSGGIDLLDMPGVLWPKFDDVEVGENLAVTGAIKDDILDTAEISIMLLRKLVRLYPDMLCARYKLGTPADIEDLQMFELFELIGRKRGFLVRGGEIDPDRTASVILDEFREGIIGRITLDRAEAQ
jgi:ribosome biogenesis GTPase A